MVFSERFKIRNSECDLDLRLRPEAVLDYYQEVAGRHCIPYDIAVPEIIENYGATWVLTGLYTEFHSYPSWPEELNVDTWAIKGAGFKAHRGFLLSGAGEKGLAEGISQWALLNIESRRPMKMETLENFMPCLPDRIPLAHARPGRVGLPESFNLPETVIEVGPSDLDYNKHVNNIRYLVWLMNYLDEQNLNTGELASLNISFTGETRLGEHIELKSLLENETGLHSFVRREDGKEVCRMETGWRSKS